MIPNNKAVVVLCADKNMEAGLHVTLYSLLSNYSRKNSGIRLQLFLQGFSTRDLALLRATLDGTHTDYELCLNKIKLDAFRDFRSLHGNYMAYARLIIADCLAQEDRFLYLDSDLVVGVDVAQLFDTDLRRQPLGAVAGGPIRNAVEHRFFMENGLGADAPYFNSGVLLFDARRWREHGLTQVCLEFCSKYPNELKTADQTVLNFVLHEQFANLEKRFNVPVYPSDAPFDPAQEENQILHFVGGPKPWDIFGRAIHRNHHLFSHYARKTAVHGRFGYGPRNLYRALRLTRSYAKLLLAKTAR